jgi:pheromone shutdown protein TraB
MEEKEKSAIERAREYGIDISLLESSLRLTIEQRIKRLQDWIEFHEGIKDARRRLYPELEFDEIDGTVQRVAPNPDK